MLDESDPRALDRPDPAELRDQRPPGDGEASDPQTAVVIDRVAPHTCAIGIRVITLTADYLCSGAGRYVCARRPDAARRLTNVMRMGESSDETQ